MGRRGGREADFLGLFGGRDFDRFWVGGEGLDFDSSWAFISYLRGFGVIQILRFSFKDGPTGWWG